MRTDAPLYRINLVGTNEASCGDIYEKSKVKTGVIPILCRSLLEAGYSPEDMVEVYREEMPVFGPTPIGWWAARQVVENDVTGLQMVKFVPFAAEEKFRGG